MLNTQLTSHDKNLMFKVMMEPLMDDITGALNYLAASLLIENQMTPTQILELDYQDFDSRYTVDSENNVLEFDVMLVRGVRVSKKTAGLVRIAKYRLAPNISLPSGLVFNSDNSVVDLEWLKSLDQKAKKIMQSIDRCQ